MLQRFPFKNEPGCNTTVAAFSVVVLEIELGLKTDLETTC